jgi:hypothetical protein
MALAKEDSNGHVPSQEKAEEKEVKPSGFKCYMVGCLRKLHVRSLPLTLATACLLVHG